MAERITVRPSIDGNRSDVSRGIESAVAKHAAELVPNLHLKRLESGRQQFYEKATEFAAKAIAADSKNSMAYARRAIANGRIALFKGVWESIDLVKSVRADLDTALALNPNNDVALYVMGRTHPRCARSRTSSASPWG